jgi:hypothetical protein
MTTPSMAFASAFPYATAAITAQFLVSAAIDLAVSVGIFQHDDSRPRRLPWGRVFRIIHHFEDYLDGIEHHRLAREDVDVEIRTNFEAFQASCGERGAWSTYFLPQPAKQIKAIAKYSFRLIGTSIIVKPGIRNCFVHLRNNPLPQTFRFRWWIFETRVGAFNDTGLLARMCEGRVMDQDRGNP